MKPTLVMRDTEGYDIAVDPRTVSSIRETRKTGVVVVHHAGGYTYINEPFDQIRNRVLGATADLED